MVEQSQGQDNNGEKIILHSLEKSAEFHKPPDEEDNPPEPMPDAEEEEEE